MKKLFIVILIMLAAVAANANDLIVGTTFGDVTQRLTTFEYRLSEPVTKYWGTEAIFGVATGFEVFDQNTDLNKYSLGFGANLTNGDAKLSGGYVISYLDGNGLRTAYPGFYGAIDFKISKSWFVQAKYTTIFDTSVGEGWQAGVGVKF